MTQFQIYFKFIRLTYFLIISNFFLSDLAFSSDHEKKVDHIDIPIQERMAQASDGISELEKLNQGKIGNAPSSGCLTSGDIARTSKVGGIISDLCKAISFAKKNGSIVSENDLYHCHVIVTEYIDENAREEIKEIEKKYSGLLCHAHEFDNKREFPNGDNVNILVKAQAQARFLGIPKTANFPELKNSGFSYPANILPQFNFYNADSKNCEKLKNKIDLNCELDNSKYCLGFYQY